jgi:hypothetical protein
LLQYHGLNSLGEESLGTSGAASFYADSTFWQRRWSSNAKLALRERVTSESKARNPGQFDYLPDPKFKPIWFNIQYLSLPQFEAITRCFIVVTEYSRGVLEISGNKLLIISGLPELVQKATGYKYLADLWAEDIRRSLIWQRLPRGDDLVLVQ